MGLIASVFRSDMTDCSNKGMSYQFDRVCVVNCDGPFDPRQDDLPAVVLVPGNLRGTVKAVPLDLHEAKKWTMMGGTFLSTSDSRFSAKIKEIAGPEGGEFPQGIVAFHDRCES